MKKLAVFTICLVLFSIPLLAQGLSIQGVLRDDTGASVADGARNFTFRLYEDGTLQWEETQNLNVLNGVYNAVLGSGNQLSTLALEDLDFNGEYWLGISVDDAEEMQPRVKMTLSPYAIASVAGVDNVVPKSGKVGINTSAPAYDLHVNGEAYVKRLHVDNTTGIVVNGHGRDLMETGWNELMGDFTALHSGQDWNFGNEPYSLGLGSRGLYFTKASTLGTPFGTVLWKSDVNGNMAASGNMYLGGTHLVYASQNGVIDWGSDGTGSLFFRTLSTTGDVTQYASQAVLTHTRRFGLGTTAPVRALHVLAGSVSYDANAYPLRLEINENDAMKGYYWDIGIDNQTNDADLVFRSKSGGEAWLEPSDGAFHHSSDRRLKKNIDAMPPMLDRVMRLKPSVYLMKTQAEMEKLHIGFVAQEVLEVLPEYNTVSDQEDNMGISYEDFSVLAIKAVQEQQALIETQGEKIRELEERLQTLEKLMQRR